MKWQSHAGVAAITYTALEGRAVSLTVTRGCTVWPAAFITDLNSATASLSYNGNSNSNNTTIEEVTTTIIFMEQQTSKSE